MTYSTYIHIGFPKTATTFLQNRVYPKIEGIHYLDRSNKFYRSTFNDLFLVDNSCDYIKGLKDQFIEYIKKQKTSKILISDEGWVGGTIAGTHLNFSNQIYLLSLMKAIFPKAKILIGIRRQDLLIESIYKHSIRDGYCQSVRSFINYENGKFCDYVSFYRKGINIDVRCLDFYKFANRYIYEYGKENILIFPQEVIQTDFHYFNEILTNFLGVKQIIDESIQQRNVGLKFHGIKTARFFNKFFIYKNRGGGFIPLGTSFILKSRRKCYRINPLLFLLNNFTPYSFGKLADQLFPSNRRLLPENISEKIIDIHSDSNKKLQDLCLFDLKRYGYY